MNINIKIIIILLLFLGINYAQDKKQVLKLNLDDFTVSFTSIIIDSYYNLDVKYNGKDSTFVSLELGDSPEENNLEINAKEIKIVGVYQKYKTSLTIMDEGPHLDLLDWLHYSSDWEKLEEINKDSFRTIKYSFKEYIMFPEVEIQMIKEAVKQYGGERWLFLLGDAKSISDYPIGIGISEIVFKIIYLEKGKNQIKYIIFNMPLGC